MFSTTKNDGESYFVKNDNNTAEYNSVIMYFF